METSQVSDWLSTISRGSLLYPNEELCNLAKILETEFFHMHGTSLSKESNIFQKLAQKTINQLPNATVAFEEILCLSRTRTYIRLKELNRKISLNNFQRKLNNFFLIYKC